MKKLWFVGRSVCVRKAVSFFSFIFFFPAIFFAQTLNIPAKFPLFEIRKFNTTPGNNKIAVFNIDDVPPYDFIFYGNNKYEFTYHSYKKLEKAKRKFFFFPITEIKLLKPGKNPDKRIYIFTSKKKKLVGAASFTKYGTLRLLNKRALFDFPEKILVGNFLGNPDKRALVFGGVFDGVNLFTFENFKLNFESVIKNETFADGGLLDLDADGMNDLVLYDALDNKFQYHLNLLNKFEISLSEKPEKKARKMKVAEIDGDKIMDFAYLSGNEIVINLTRSNPKTKQIIKLKTGNCVDYDFSDFTFDFKKDFIWINGNGEIWYRVRESKQKFTPPLYLKKLTGAVSINTVWNTDRREIVILSENGFFEKYTPVNKIKNSTEILLPDFRKNSHPLFFVRKNKLEVVWLSETYPALYGIGFYYDGKIEKKILPLSFFPDGILSSGRDILFTSKNDSTVLLLNKDSLYKKIPANILSENFVIEKKRNFAVNLADTLVITFEFEEIISRNKNKNDFVFLNKNELIFAKVLNDSIKAVKRLLVDENSKVFPLSVFPDKPGAALIKGNKITFISENSRKEFRANYNLLRNANLSFCFFEKETGAIALKDEKKNDIYLAAIKKRRSYLAFRKVYPAINSKRYVLTQINDKLFACFFNTEMKSLKFIEIK